MSSFSHPKSEQLEAMEYSEVSLISETEGYDIYRALKPDGMSVFIKFPTSAMPPGQLEHELKITNKLNSTSVLRPIKIEQISNQPVLIMESCAYSPLTQLLQAPLDISNFLPLAIGIATALSEVHRQGIVHNQIQPEHIFANESGQAKLTGFGEASKLTREQQPDNSELKFITSALAYRAPERNGHQGVPVDTRSDLYSLGVTFYRMLTGRLPFTATDSLQRADSDTNVLPKPPNKCLQTIPQQLSDLVLDLIAQAVEDRYQTVEGLKTDLQYCLEDWSEFASIKPFQRENARLFGKLRDSETKYRQIIDTANEGIWVQDENYVTTFVNEHMAQMLGYTADELYGRKVTEFMFEEGVVDHVDKMNERRKNHSGIYERRMRHKDGRVVWMLISATPIFEGSQFNGSFGVLTDISRRKEAELKLVASEQLFRTLVENSPDNIARYDLNLRRVYINPTLEKLLTVPLDKAIGKTSEINSPLLDPQAYMANIQRVIDNGQECADEIAYRTPQGEIGWASARFVPEFGVEGQVESVLVISNNTTERKKAELQLINSRQKYQNLINNLPDCIIRFDADGQPIFINSTVEKTFGLINEQTINKPLTDARKPDGIKHNLELTQSIKRVFESGEAEQIEAEWETLKGIRTFEVSHIPERDSQDRIQSVLGIARDITATRQIDKANKELVHFLKCLDRINLVLQSGGDIEQILNSALNEVLDIFACDRAYLIYPCDPSASSWSVPFERTRLEYPGSFELGQQIPVTEYVAYLMEQLLAADHPLRMGPGTQYPLTGAIVEQFQIRSMMVMAIYPRVDRPWQLGLHQCSRERAWSDQELRLFEEIGHRLSDGLNSLLIARNLRESEERFRQVYENSPVPIWEEDFSAVKILLDELKEVCGDDLEGYLTDHPQVVRDCAAAVRIVNINSAVLELHEAKSKEALLEDLPKTFLPESYTTFRSELVALADGHTEHSFDSVVQTLNGKRRDVSVSFSVCPGYEKNLAKVFVSLYDITQRKQNEDQLRLAASVFSTSQEGIMISDANNCIIDVNPAFTQLTGYNREEAIGQNPSFLRADQQDSTFYSRVWQSIESDGEWQGETWNRRKSGEVFPEQLSIVAVKDAKGQLQHYVGAFSDISTLKMHEADLDRIANYDMLTSVPNRRLLHNRMEQAIAYARRHGKSLAVCYLDLDGFKPINDQFGHEGGDRMLIETARRLESLSRGEDTVSRLGGDEFVLLWNDIGAEADCIRALERILQEISKPILLNNTPVTVSASIGVTVYPEDNVDADSLLRHADHAMYIAKQHGKNRYQIFDAGLERQISEQAEHLARVALGLDQNQFELYYQPKVDYTTGEVVSVEALLRWNDPVLGLVSPIDFLPQIENDSMAFRMGRWVMQQAIGQAKIWNDVGMTMPISINIFPLHLKHQNFVDDLREMISAHWPQLPKHRLLMEIVETVDLEELEPIEQIIKQCLDLGVGFSLDDFGTGYSSLVYLRRLSIEELKIDQSFVRDMLEDPSDKAIVKGVISLGQAFGLRVVAEGVETSKQASHLADLGCTIVQGFGFGHPMTAKDFKAWYEKFQK